MTVQGSTNTPGNNESATSSPAAGPGLQNRLFQDHLLQQQLAQIVAPPTVTAPAGTGGSPLLPLPVTPMTPHTQGQQKDHGLTPYIQPKIPGYIPKPAGQPGSVQGTGQPNIQNLFDPTSGNAGNPPATVQNPTNISAWNALLSRISKTLSLQLLSPNAQLQINRLSDLNPGLNAEYALGLQIGADQNLALTGSLKELVPFLAESGNAKYFMQMLNPNAGMKPADLEQRYDQAVSAENHRITLNFTRQQLKNIQTGTSSNTQSFANLYPDLTLGTVADRSKAWQNGFAVNRESDLNGAKLNQPYVFEFDYPVLITNDKTYQIPVSLSGTLDQLGPFIKAGGHSWLQANGLAGNQNTGLTPEGLVTRYEKAKASEFNPNTRSTEQTGSTVEQQLIKETNLKPADDPDSTVRTTFAGGSKKASDISYKPADKSKDQEDKGIISLRPSKPLQINTPENTNSNGVIKASASDENNQPEPSDNSQSNHGLTKGQLRRGLKYPEYQLMLDKGKRLELVHEFLKALHISDAEILAARKLKPENKPNLEDAIEVLTKKKQALIDIVDHFQKIHPETEIPTGSLIRHITAFLFDQAAPANKQLTPNIIKRLHALETTLIQKPRETTPLKRLIHLQIFPQKQIDLRGWDLSNLPLMGINLANVQLDNADLSGANLQGANLSGANLEKAKLTGTNLSGARLIKTNLKTADLTEANLIQADLKDASLQHAELSRAHLNFARLPNADLTHAILNKTNLSNAGLSGAKLDHATMIDGNLSDADLRAASFTDAVLDETDLTGIMRSDQTSFVRTSFEGANLRYVNLSEMHLDGNNFHKAKLEGADLQRASLRGANLSEARLDDTVLHGAVLIGANLNRAHLKNTVLTNASLHGALLIKATLQNVIFGETILTEANLAETNLSGYDFSKMRDLRSTRFNGATLIGTLFNEADLTSATFNNANLERAQFKHAILNGAQFIDAELPNADLSEATISNTDFTRAILLEAVLTGLKINRISPVFSGADLSFADLSNSNLRGANFNGASLYDITVLNTAFQNADFTNANMNTKDLLEIKTTAETNNNTIFPEL